MRQIGWRVSLIGGIPGLLVVVLAVLALMLTTAADPVSAAPASGCRVTNRDSGKTHRWLQAAVRRAAPGDRLIVRGTCRKGTVIDRDLVIEGRRNRRFGKPILDGKDRQRVLLIGASVRVVIRGLAIRDGQADRGAGVLNLGTLVLRRVVLHHNRASDRGGGIGNMGTLDIRDVRVRDNQAGGSGGGVHNLGTLRAYGGNRIVRNVATQASGGVSNQGSMTLSGTSRIAGNEGGVNNQGTLTLDDASTITDNAMTGVLNHGRLSLNDTSSITANRGVRGAGIWNVMGGILVMSDASAISGNFADHLGGGIYNEGTVTLNDSTTISGNQAGSEGGGIWNSYSIVMTGSSSIRGNFAGYRGGGLFHWGMTATLSGVSCGGQTAANVYDNAPDDCQRLGPG